MIKTRPGKATLKARAKIEERLAASSPVDEERAVYFRDNYNTFLTPEQETKFQGWMREESKRKGRDVSMDLYDYDVRGAWLNKMVPKEGHGTDRFKKPSHPTFSNESIYHGTDSPFGWKWEGGEWGQQGDIPTFAPSQRMLQTTHPRPYLEQYFKRMKMREPNLVPTRLIIK